MEKKNISRNLTNSSLAHNSSFRDRKIFTKLIKINIISEGSASEDDKRVPDVFKRLRGIVDSDGDSD